MEKWIKQLHNKNYAKNTITTYKNVVLNLNLNANLSKKKLKANILDKAKSSNTKLLYIAVAQQYYKFYKDKMRLNFVNELNRPQKPQHYFRVVSKYIIEKRLGINFDDSIQDIYWKNIILLLFETGMRASELQQIIKISNNTLTILGKGSKVRDVFCKNNTISQIIKIEEKIFPYSTKTLRLMVKKYLGSKVTPHTIRRSFATYMLKSGANPKMVQLQLGHKKIETTFNYLHLSYAYNLKIYRKYIK